MVTVHMLVEGNYADVQGGVVSEANQTVLETFLGCGMGFKTRKVVP